LWLTPKATSMTPGDWNFAEARFLAYVLGAVDERGVPMLIVLNAAPDAIDMTMPEVARARRWKELLNTAGGDLRELTAGTVSPAPGRSVCVFAGAP
jgi:glycogen operon protein